jgi:hypothetical protein
VRIPARSTPCASRDRPNGVGMRSWKEVLSCDDGSRCSVVSPVRASSTRSTVRVDRSWSACRHECRVGPWCTGTPSPCRAHHGCTTPVTIKSYPCPDRITGRRNTPPETTGVICSPPLRAPPWRPGPPQRSRVLGGQHLVWVRRDLVQQKSFMSEDCFPIDRERLPILKKISFWRDLWSSKTWQASFVDIVKMADGGRGVIRL